MASQKNIDSYFNNTGRHPQQNKKDAFAKHTHIIKMMKLLLPSIAAVLLGMLIIIPNLSQIDDTVSLDITLPKKGELEKLHMENTDFYITDRNNKVNNFLARNIDETSPGSKLIKLTDPEGIIPSANGTWYNIKSPLGYYDQNKNTLKLEQQVDVFYSDGMTAKTTEFLYDFKTGIGTSVTPVSADGELGTLSAEGMEFYNDQNLIIFTGKTHIVIDDGKH